MTKDGQKFKIKRSKLYKAMRLYNYIYPLKEITAVEKHGEAVFFINGTKVDITHM